MSFSPFDAAAVLVVLVATFGYFNHRYLGLPASVAMTGMGAIGSLLIVALDYLIPDRRFVGNNCRLSLGN